MSKFLKLIFKHDIFENQLSKSSFKIWISKFKKWVLKI